MKIKIAKCCHTCLEFCKNNTYSVGMKQCDKLKRKVHSLQICQHYNPDMEQITKISIKITNNY